MAVVLLAGATSACRGPGSWFGMKKQPTGDAITVAASFYPIAEIVQRVGADKVNVLNLTPAGTDAHDVELTAKQLQQLQDAKVTFYLGEKFQPSVFKAISSVKGATVDLLKVTPTSGFTCGTCDGDPHVWLNPSNMVLMTKEVSLKLSAARPDLAAMFTANSSAYIAELEGVGKKIDTAFSTCASRVLVTSHYSFSYFANRANLTMYSLAPSNPDAQLSAQQIEKLTNELKSARVSTIFSEEMVASTLVNTVAQSIGASVSSLQPLEGITNADLKADKNYITFQLDNIKRIAQGLGCS